ncbi:magnesium and cobalt transport protein CorA [Gulosibacter chungangensis]|uniref:Magnesium and cobalt transport protein CorA n=1 Tax=Gulosibacter chungangensis TaxID=979746 RepID=A0A7J5B9N7_9MICO|nr:magnesium and cobalt transport protein CorA [Gulosibacter chungangensis]KAB1640569.1 magnesium and cobalt transport protein CorA [Gulosibacter chungangensis]
MVKERHARFGFRLPERGGASAHPSQVAGANGPTIRFVTDGHPAAAPDRTTIGEALEFGQSAPDHMSMLFYPNPTPESLAELGTEWDLHPVLVEDLILGKQRPKLERYGDVLFLVVRAAHYVDEIEEIDFSEFHILMRPGAVAIICQDARWIDGQSSEVLDKDHPFASTLRDASLLGGINLLGLGPEAVIYRLIDAVVDGYGPVLQGLEIDKEQIERQVFSGEKTVTERIYRLTQEVIDLQQTISSMTVILDRLKAGFDKYEIPEELQKYLDDVSDHLMHATTHVRDLRESLTQILNVNATLVAQQQNEDMKKISGWAAILFAPTLIGAIYGMNFDDMPELHWALGYPMALGMMVLLAVVLYVVFKKSKWM